VEGIRTAAKRAAGLTRQLLAFSRRQVLKPEVVNLNDIIADLTKMLGRLIGEDIELVTVPAPQLGQVRVDPGQMEQVVMNLVVNAREALPRGGKLTIETAEVDVGETLPCPCGEAHGGHYVVLKVTDTGEGMDEETRAHVFEPFFTTKEKGTGLGLATVYGIVMQSGGHITVDSEPGQGTTFSIYLPPVEDGTGSPARTGNPGASPETTGSETILIVEDDETVLDLACRILSDNGYTVITAGDGEEALRLCGEHEGSVHLLLTDVILPGGMSGRELADQLASLRPELRVVYTSGYTSAAIAGYGVLEEGVPLVEKPFTPARLLGEVRAALDE
jgi:CheY-like chemotaxis protein